MFKCFSFRKHEMDPANYLKIVLTQATLNESYTGLTQWPLLRVIRGHMRSYAFFAPKFERIEAEQWGLFQCVSFAWDTSTDMQHNLPGSPRDLT